MPKSIKTLVMYAPIRDVNITEVLYPKSRYHEILECKNENARREKYLVWKLLEQAIKTGTDLDFANLEFTKTANGKWVCYDLYFSLSHTDGVVCVAVSDQPIGVDVEAAKDIRPALANKILTEGERAIMESIPKDKRGRFLLDAGVKKESIFKMRGGEALLPNRIESTSVKVKMHSVTVSDREYVIAIAAENDNIEIVYTEEL